MKRTGLILRLAVSLGGTAIARAAQPSGPIIELPPMIVSETRDPITWRYASVRSDEYLSNCSVAATRRFIESRERVLYHLRAIVPAEFLADLPTITILSDRSHEPKAGDTVAREVLGSGASARASQERASSVRFLPNLRIDARDLSALFAFIDDDPLAQTELTLTPNYLRYLLERRTPMLPPWLIEGVLAVHQQINLPKKPVMLRPLTWLSPEETSALASNPLQPRALLPANEMFAPDALRGESNHHPQRVQTLRAQVGLFVRWALDPRNQARDAFWDFARRATGQRVTEELFFECFRFGFSDLRDRLSDYLLFAVKDPLQLDPGPAPKSAAPDVRDATPLQIARLRGTWERLEIGYVQKSQPDFAGRYITQARQTLQRPYERGETDPWLLAEIGLCEIDAGAPEAALKFLAPAIAAGAIRPEACYEVGRLRFAELTRNQPASRIFSVAEIAPIVNPLRQALQQTPQLPEVYASLADIWLRCQELPPTPDVEALVHGAAAFALNPIVSFRVALLLARCGRRTEAIALLATGADYVTDDARRARYTQLQTALENSKPAAP